MRIIPRAEWNARPPKNRVLTTWRSRTGFVTHYSGASAKQTVRSIQDYCMDVRKFADIDYNFLVDTAGRIYEGRGWMVVGSHVLNQNTPNIGVCAIGLDKDITPAQMASIRWLYAEANRLAGKTLAKRTHGGLTGKTDCPGKRLQAWVSAGMPDPLPKPTPAPHPAYPGRVMSRNAAVNAGVKTWQARMKARGWTIKVDGIFGAETLRVVKAFQAEKKLQVTGTINRATWDAAWTAPVTK